MICPALVVELRRPICVLRSPGSCEPSDQVAGQNNARERIAQTCAKKSAANVDAKAKTTPASANAAEEASASHFPPKRSVHAPPRRLNAICRTTGSATRLPTATPE